MSMLMDLGREGQKILKEWENTILIPIPKKGNLHLCNSWRINNCSTWWSRRFSGKNCIGSFTEVCWNVIARVSISILARLVAVLYNIYIVLTIREGIWSQFQIIFVFVYLRKAYNLVLRDHVALWIALRKLGVTEAMINNLVRFFHIGMKATLRVDRNDFKPPASLYNSSDLV